MRETVARDGRGDLGSEAGGQVRFVQHEHPARSAHGREHRLPVPGNQGTQIDHFDLDALLALKRSFFHCPQHADSVRDDCQVAAFARQGASRELVLDGLVASLDGSRLLRDQMTAPVADAEALGGRLAARLIGLGARDILEEIERQV